MSTSSRLSSSGKRRLPGQAGFTLVELLVVISIMLVLTSIFILNQNRFNSSTLLRSLSYSIALSVRQAQVYGTSIRESSAGAFDTGSAAKSYGVYFSQADAQASPSQYTLFADANNNGKYDNGEQVQIFKLNSGYTISKFCVTPSGGTANSVCYPSGTSGTITTMTVMFKRPNPDACFDSSSAQTACATGATAQYSGGYIQLKSGNDTRSVTVTLTGQISIGTQGS